MSTPTPPDDSHLQVLLTAYADGSLHDEGCAFIERQLEEHPELRDRLGEIRALQHLLRSSLPAIPSKLEEGRRAVVMAAASQPARASGRPWMRHIVTLAAACLALATIAMIATPNLMESRVTAVAAAERARARYMKDEATPAACSPAPIAGSAGLPRDMLGYAGQGSTNGSAISSLDLPTETSSKEDDSPVPKGREEAVADSDIGGSGALLTFGRNNPASGSKPGRRTTPPAASPQVAMKEKSRPAEPGADRGNSLRNSQRDRLGGNQKAAAPASSVPESKIIQPAKPGIARQGPGEAQERELLKRGAIDKSSAAQPLAGYVGSDRKQEATKTGQLQNYAFAANLQTAGDGEDRRKDGSPLGRVTQTWSPLLQRDLIAALTNRGLAERSVGRLDEVLLQQWNAPMQQQAAPIRLTADPGRQAGATGSAANSVGQNLLLAANRNGLQLVPVPGGIEVQAAQRPLDPTAYFGLSRDDFRTAFGSTPMQAVSEDPQQTFAIDASTSSFATARAALEAGRLPDPGAIEPQHLYNAVPADYPKPSGEEAFQLYAEAGPSPFANGPAAARTALVALGVVSRAADAAERMPLDLVVALDVSGSMGRPGGLDRASAGLNALLPQLDARDRVAVVAFGDVARVVLPALPGDQHQRIAGAIAGLRPEGATNAADGLALAYQVAGELAAPGRSCRVLLATDGAALAGEAAATAEAAVERWRGRGVSLLIVGCAGEAYDSAALERLARHGDGEHLVAASDDAARELFTDRLMPARLAVLARDAKVQMTWNPARVSHARLIGFETRRLAHEQFRDDRVDAGELAQDAQATALFEVILSEHGSGPLGTAGVRYRDTRLDRVVELNRPLPGGLVAAAPSQRLQLLACAAELGELMQAGWWRNVRCAAGSEPHDRLRAELARIDHPFARLLERMAQRHQQLERQDATP